MGWLTGDCSRCDGLCCVALPFDTSESFAFDKSADIPCRHLAATSTCAIHAELAAIGQRGCNAYDCNGAGQRIVTQIFPGCSWRDGAEAREAILEAFRVLVRVHALTNLFSVACARSLIPADDATFAKLCAPHSPASLAALDIDALEAEARARLRALAPPFTSMPSEAPARSGVTAPRKRGLPMIDSFRASVRPRTD